MLRFANLFLFISVACLGCAFLTNAASTSCFAHDIWIETSSSIVRIDEPVTIHLKLGNCSHGKPDGKTDGQLPQEAVRAVARLPSGLTIELSKTLVSSSQQEGNGFWRSNITINEVGCTWLIQRLDDKITHDGRKVLGKMIAKTPLVVTRELDDVSLRVQAVSHSQPIEFLLESSVLPSIESGEAIDVRLLKNGQPLAHAQIAFTRPFELNSEGEVQHAYLATDTNGRASWIPTQPGPLLISCTQLDESEKGADYDATYYSTSMYLNINEASIILPTIAKKENLNQHAIKPQQQFCDFNRTITEKPVANFYPDARVSKHPF